MCLRDGGNIGAMRLFLLCIIFFALVSCERSSDSSKGKSALPARIQNSQSSSAQGNKKSKETTDITSRAEYIKKQIEKYKEWGGHSAVPQRVVTANTFTKVRQKIDSEDASALIILLQDDAGEIRSIAASLLDCVDPNAQNDIEKQLSKETDVERKDRLRDALIQIRVIRAGGTSCK